MGQERGRCAEKHKLYLETIHFLSFFLSLERFCRPSTFFSPIVIYGGALNKRLLFYLEKDAPHRWVYLRSIFLVHVKYLRYIWRQSLFINHQWLLIREVRRTNHFPCALNIQYSLFGYHFIEILYMGSKTSRYCHRHRFFPKYIPLTYPDSALICEKEKEMVPSRGLTLANEHVLQIKKQFHLGSNFDVSWIIKRGARVIWQSE